MARCDEAHNDDGNDPGPGLETLAIVDFNDIVKYQYTHISWLRVYDIEI